MHWSASFLFLLLVPSNFCKLWSWIVFGHLGLHIIISIRATHRQSCSILFKIVMSIITIITNCRWLQLFLLFQLLTLPNIVILGAHTFILRGLIFVIIIRFSLLWITEPFPLLLSFRHLMTKWSIFGIGIIVIIQLLLSALPDFLINHLLLWSLFLFQLILVVDFGTAGTTIVARASNFTRSDMTVLSEFLGFVADGGC